MRHEAVATLSFDLKREGSAAAHRAVATGIVNQDGSFVFLGRCERTRRRAARIAMITGKFASNEERLTLSLKTEPSNIPDGFNGQGTINAVSTGPAPPKNKRQEAVF
ncbi:MAG: hypothetical protein WKF30_11955 [Pyrinomonadaceae bacterium]